MVFSFIDSSTFYNSRFKDLLSNDLFCDDDDDKSKTSIKDDDFERDKYSTDESDTTIFLNDSIFESETLNSMSS
jgi:hypothetical protein